MEIPQRPRVAYKFHCKRNNYSKIISIGLTSLLLGIFKLRLDVFLRDAIAQLDIMSSRQNDLVKFHGLNYAGSQDALS